MQYGDKEENEGPRKNEQDQSGDLSEPDGKKLRTNKSYGTETVTIESSLSPLVDPRSGYIVLGRSSSAHKKWGRKGLLHMGRVGEAQAKGESHFNRDVFLDAAFPHIVFVCGKRGSGKSYTLGVFAEELVRSAIGVGVVLIDPIGIFWSLKRKNSNKREIEALEEWGLSTHSFPEVRVLVPEGDRNSSNESSDGPFYIGVGELTSEDWCQVFDIDRFKTQGLLVGSAIDQVRKGYDSILEGNIIQIQGKGDHYSIGDIIQCIETSVFITSKSGGYSIQTRRSMIARFKAAAEWGIFSTDGTPLRDITSPNKVTVVDVSDPSLGDSKRSLITGIIARKILGARIHSARIEERENIDENDPTLIPVTWLLIDEAHVILPHGRQTPATEALVEYAKQGRRPGCALVLATQRPASTSDEILSQVDLLVGHNLALEDDMTALRRRVPSKLPSEFANSDFIRAIPVGMAIMADQRTQQRAFLMQVRPRISHHAGSSAMPKAFIERKVEKPIIPLSGTERPIKGEEDVLEPTSGNEEKSVENVFERTVEKEKVTDDKERISGEISEDVDEKKEIYSPNKKVKADIMRSGKEEIPKDGGSMMESLDLSSVPYGTSFLLKEYTVQKIPELFLDLPKGTPVLLLTRTHPEKYSIPEEMKLVGGYWLSSTPSENAISPTSLQEMSLRVGEFMSENEHGVVILEGVEYLHHNVGIGPLRKFIETIGEKAYIGKHILFIIAGEGSDPELMDAVKAEIDRELDPKSGLYVKEGSGVGKNKEDDKAHGQLQLNELKWMCEVMGLPTTGDEKELLQRILDHELAVDVRDQGRPENSMKLGNDDSQSKVKELLKDIGRIRKENRSLKTRLNELEKNADIKVKGERDGPTGKTSGAKLVLEWLDEEEESKRKTDKLMAEISRLRSKVEESEKRVRDSDPANNAGKESNMIKAFMDNIEREREETRNRLDRLEKLLRKDLEQAFSHSKEDKEKSKENTKIQAVGKKQRSRTELEKGKDDHLGSIEKKKAKVKRSEKNKKLRKLAEGNKGTIVMPKTTRTSALETVKRSLKRGLFKGPRERVEELIPAYIPIYRQLVVYKGGLLKKRREGDLFIDGLLGEVVTSGKNGLKRSVGLKKMASLTDIELRIAKAVGNGGDDTQVSKRSGLSLRNTRRALTSLKKKGIVDIRELEGGVKLYSMDGSISIPKKPWTSDIGLRPMEAGGIEDPMMDPLVESDEADRILRVLSDELEPVERDIIHYPVYLAKVRGEGRERIMVVDGISSRLDEDLFGIVGPIANKMGIWEMDRD